MRIIPVIDFMGGLIVQAVRGERQFYGPVNSVLASGRDPLALARALQIETGCQEFYVADLDALMGRPEQLPLIKSIAAELKADIWLDAAITNAQAVETVVKAGAKVIVGSETLTDIGILKEIRKALPENNLLFSMDIAKNRVISQCSNLKGKSPLKALDIVAAEGINHFIILTLDQVGTGSGPDIKLLKDVCSRFPSLSFIAGGGIRKLEDLLLLNSLEIDGVLLATALHRGWITRSDIEELKADT